MNNHNEFERIPPEKFEFVQMDARLHDKKLETKSRSFFQDAMLRFRKNKSSVAAAWILLFLVIFAIVAPLVSPYDINDKDKLYINYPAYVPEIAELGWGIMDGSKIHGSQNETSMNYWNGIAVETGLNPVLDIVKTTTTLVKYRGQMVERNVYDLKVNRYYELGVVYRIFSYAEFEKIQAWQDETGIQVIYPYVEPKDIEGISDNPNIWYQVDSKGAAVLDDDGNFVPMYSTRSDIEGAPYHSQRIAGDDGSYIYSVKKDGAVQARVCYYNYYQYLNGHEPSYIFGTTTLGQDLFSAVGIGARFSLIFAIVVSIINLGIGAIYGAIQGYYGGYVDMAMDRVADVLSGVPFVVVATLFQLHMSAKVGVVGAFLFAFVLTGWIGMAALTRKQFYRFKSQEFVMAARTLGASDGRLMFKHIFPNAIGTIITSCALIIPNVIRSETTMTYLGIVSLTDLAGTTIGTLLSQGNAAVTTAPHTLLWPSLFLGLLMISFNLFGNGLRDAFNPTTRGEDD
ncbi:MAG TPA: ABC transporter permease [Candidatus Faecousia intestinigallinarum]|nr:ABC transporter permease [Candidatus Faecousia intestinigallinarum]